MPRFSQRSTEATLHAVLARVAAKPSRVADVLAEREEALVAFTPERHIVAASPAAERLFGYERGSLDGISTDLLIPERFRQPDAPPMAATPDLMSVDLPALASDGVEIHLAWTFGAVAVASPPLFVMIVRNRVEIDDALEALRVSEERFRLLVEGVRDHAIFMLDAEGRVSTWNEGAERIHLHSGADIVGRGFSTFFAADDDAAEKLLARALEAGSSEASGWRLRKDGTRFHACSSVSALRAGAGELRGFAVVNHDLTSRDRAEENERRLDEERSARHAAEAAEERARLSEERVQRLHAMTTALAAAAAPAEVASLSLAECIGLLDAAGGAVYMVSVDGSALELVEQVGHSPELLAPYRTIALDASLPLTDAARSGAATFYDDREDWRARYPRLAQQAESSHFEASAVLPLKSRHALIGVLTVRYRAARRFSEAERALLLTVAEICAQALERARLFAAEQTARAGAEAASRAKDEFLAMLGHELRNPLAPIVTALHLMKLRNGEPTTRERDIIERQVGHMTKLVDDLLDVSRIAQGRVALVREHVSVREVVARAVEMTGPLFAQRRHELTVVTPDDVHVFADPSRLAQVVGNLLANAAKYTRPGGHIALRAEATEEELAIHVRDDGAGITAELLPDVFDIFVQGKRTLARSEGGLGLGLALVKNLTAMHGGTVSAASEGPGRGSEFVVRLPRTGTSTDPPASSLPAAVELRSNLGPRLRILVVDDNEDAAETLASALRHHDHLVEVSLDGPSALARLRDFTADVAVLDLGLPTIDGFEIARRIAAEFPDRPPRLVAVTGYGQEKDIARSAAAGFDAHLTKPVALDAVLAALRPRLG